MSTWDPTQTYVAGPPTTGDGSFPVTGPVGLATQDSIYGISNRLAKIPVKIDNGGQITGAKGAGLDTYGGGSTPGPAAPEIIPWESSIAMLYTMDPQSRAAIQRQLYDAGLYPKAYYGKTPEVIVPGEIDPGTETAWRNAIELAVRSSTYDSKTGALQNAKSIQDVITERAQERIGEAQNAGAKAVRLTNPTDLRQIAREESQKLIGRFADPSFVDNFVAAYHDQEAQQYQSSDASGNVVTAPDARAFAQQLLRQQYPVDVKANDYLNVGNELVNALSQPAGANLPTDRTVNG